MTRKRRKHTGSEAQVVIMATVTPGSPLARPRSRLAAIQLQSRKRPLGLRVVAPHRLHPNLHDTPLDADRHASPITSTVGNVLLLATEQGRLTAGLQGSSCA